MIRSASATGAEEIAKKKKEVEMTSFIAHLGGSIAFSVRLLYRWGPQNTDHNENVHKTWLQSSIESRKGSGRVLCTGGEKSTWESRATCGIKVNRVMARYLPSGSHALKWGLEPYLGFSALKHYSDWFCNRLYIQTGIERIGGDIQRGKKIIRREANFRSTEPIERILFTLKIKRTAKWGSRKHRFDPFNEQTKLVDQILKLTIGNRTL